jgi:hypothetical protein
LPQFTNALQGAGRQSQHLEAEDNAWTALLYMRFRHESQGRKRTRDALPSGLLALANEVIE